MARKIDCIHKKFQKIKELLALIIQYTFMMKTFSKLYRKLPRLKEYLNWFRGEKRNRLHAFNNKESLMCGIEQFIEELFYAKEASNRQRHASCLGIGD